MEKLNSRTLAWPTDWAAVFGQERRLLVEIGFGEGAFLLHLAQSHPMDNIIGIEIANRSLSKTEAKIEQKQLKNVRMIHSMAETALHHLFVPGSIQQVYINFPDPWFKNDHSHRRLMQRDTLDVIVNRLTPGGELYLATDILAYAEMSHELLAATPGLDNLLLSAWMDSLPGRVVTKYEAAAQREGRTCYYFAYRRNDRLVPDVPVIKEAAMPHVVFVSPLRLDVIAQRFEEQTVSEDGINVHLNHAFLGNGLLLIEAHVGEPTITQHVALLIGTRKHPDTVSTELHEYTIQLSTIGQPRPTPGIHRAVRLLTDWVLRLHPENRILKEKVSAE